MISDTHAHHGKVDLPEGDLLIHAGDFTNTGYRNEVEDFLKWLKKVSRKYTYGSVFIAGNHDRSFDPKYLREYDNDAPEGEKPLWLQELLNKYVNPSYGIRYLENSSTTVQGLKIWGSPHTPWFHGDTWAFNRYRGEEIRETWNTIPGDVDIVVTHGPSKGTLDQVERGNEHVGCEDLRQVINAISPKLFVFGHIHEGYGMTKKLGTIHVNASVCTAIYKPNNPVRMILISK